MKKILISIIILNSYFSYSQSEIDLIVVDCKLIKKNDFRGSDSKYNGTYLVGWFDLINNTIDTLNVPNLGMLDRWTGFTPNLKLYGFDKTSFSISITTNNHMKNINGKSLNEVFPIIEAEPIKLPESNKRNRGDLFVLNKWSVKKILPKKKKRFYFNKKVGPMKNSDSLKVEIKLRYDTSFIKKGFIEKLEKNYVKRIEKIERKLTKEFKTKQDLESYRKKCYKELENFDQKLCNLILEKVSLKSDEKTYFSQLNFIKQITPLFIESPLYRKVVLMN